jgi:uncharacterized protein YndB with AHSA1/START domain
VQFEVFYPHPPQRVWRALTDPVALTRWLMPTDFRPRLGHKFRFWNRARHEEIVCCEVVALEEARRLAFTWQSERETQPTLVTWTLEAEEGGTRLRLEHIGSETPDRLAFPLEARLNWSAALGTSLPLQLRMLPPLLRFEQVGRLVLPKEGNSVRCISRRRIGVRFGEEKKSCR